MDVSRRDLLKGGGVLAAGLLAGSGVAALGGCSGKPSDDVVEKVTENGITYEVYDTEVLLIGAGINAATACSQTTNLGHRVLVVDKGPIGFSGASGMNFGGTTDTVLPLQIGETPNPACAESDYNLLNVDRFMDQERYKRAVLTNPYPYYPDLIMDFGDAYAVRNEDGTIKPIGKTKNMLVFDCMMQRHWLDHAFTSNYVTVQDRVMITDLLINGDECLGAIGLHIPTGTYRVYRAKATIDCTSDTTQFYGWITCKAKTDSTADATADVDMALFRRGVRIGDAEQAAYDFIGVNPTGVACAYSGTYGTEFTFFTSVVDKDGNAYLTDPEKYDQEKLEYDAAYFSTCISKALIEGKGSENGGIYVKYTAEEVSKLKYLFQRNIGFLKEKFNFDATQELLECVPEMFCKGGKYFADIKMMSKDFKGLFCGRPGGCAGSNSGGMINLFRIYGTYTGLCVHEYLQTYEPPAEVDWSVVETECARLEELLNREPESPISQIALRRSIQAACDPAFSIVRNDDDLEQAKKELERIEKEDLPRMVVRAKEREYNTDWKEAIENINILQAARMSIEATLFRPESRGRYIRSAYPEVDESWFQTATAAKLEEDGSITMDKEILPTCDWVS